MRFLRKRRPPHGEIRIRCGIVWLPTTLPMLTDWHEETIWLRTAAWKEIYQAPERQWVLIGWVPFHQVT